MRRVIKYVILFLLLSTAISSFGWYLSCNKPCDPEYVMVPGDTVFIRPKPESVISLTDTVKPVKKRGKEVTVHKVRRGETIYGIATRTYNIPISALMEINHLTDANIEAGQELYIGTAQQRDSIRRSYGSDSLYTTRKEFGDKNVKGVVITQSFGPVLYQSVDWEGLMEKPRSRIYAGGGLDDMRNVSAKGMFIPKAGRFAYTIDYGILGEKRFQAGVLYRLK